IAHEFISQTKYRIVADPNQADAVLSGYVAQFAYYPVIYDPVSGRATGVQAVVILNITLTAREGGKVLYSRAGADFHERYEIATDPKQYFDESGTAMERLSHDVARGVVSAILENF
ncbi:MAG TPA: hypothetical protein VGF59_16800, partial [Bryobacteraceae bacterium]